MLFNWSRIFDQTFFLLFNETENGNKMNGKDMNYLRTVVVYIFLLHPFCKLLQTKKNRINFVCELYWNTIVNVNKRAFLKLTSNDICVCVWVRMCFCVCICVCLCVCKCTYIWISERMHSTAHIHMPCCFHYNMDWEFWEFCQSKKNTYQILMFVLIRRKEKLKIYRSENIQLALILANSFIINVILFYFHNFRITYHRWRVGVDQR